MATRAPWEQPHSAETGIPSKEARPVRVGAVGCRLQEPQGLGGGGHGDGRQRRQGQSHEEDEMYSAEIPELYPVENMASEGVYFPISRNLRKPLSIFRMSSIYSVF